MLVLVAAVLMTVGLLLVPVGVQGWRGRLRRNRFMGVRTAATMRSEDAFLLGNRVAGPVVLAAGVVALLGGVAALTVSSAAAGWTVLAVAGTGTFGLAVVGGVLGSAAAARFTPVQRAGCAACVCGSPGSRGCLAASASEDKGR